MNYPIVIIAEETKAVFPVELKKKESRSGENEYEFLNSLLPIFGDKVSWFYKLEIYSKIVYPDIGYWDEKLRIGVDIEIDEPYSRNEIKPIHVYNNSEENERNLVLNKSGWSIIRFSEYQIIRHKEECIKLISEVIKSLKTKETFLLRRINYPELFIHPRWSEDDAIEMARNSIRDRYEFKLKEIIDEKETCLKLCFKSMEDLTFFSLDYMISEKLSENNFQKEEYLFFISDISDILYHEKTKKEYLFIKLCSSHELYKDGHLVFNTEEPISYKLEKGCDDMFYKLLEIKKGGKIIGLSYNRSFFNFILKGLKKLNNENAQDLIEIMHQNSKGGSLFINKYFILSN